MIDIFDKVVLNFILEKGIELNPNLSGANTYKNTYKVLYSSAGPPYNFV